LDALTSGMGVEQFWDSSIVDVIYSITAYNRRETDAWQRTRFQSYIVYCSVTDEGKRKSIYEFLELENDPTQEEIDVMNLQNAQKEDEELKAFYEQARRDGVV
jgi:hypothetical protein